MTGCWISFISCVYTYVYVLCVINLDAAVIGWSKTDFIYSRTTSSLYFHWILPTLVCRRAWYIYVTAMQLFCSYLLSCEAVPVQLSTSGVHFPQHQEHHNYHTVQMSRTFVLCIQCFGVNSKIVYIQFSSLFHESQMSHHPRINITQLFHFI